jgi:hypothetical protein
MNSKKLNFKHNITRVQFTFSTIILKKNIAFLVQKSVTTKKSFTIFTEKQKLSKTATNFVKLSFKIFFHLLSLLKNQDLC